MTFFKRCLFKNVCPCLWHYCLNVLFCLWFGNKIIGMQMFGINYYMLLLSLYLIDLLRSFYWCSLNHRPFDWICKVLTISVSFCLPNKETESQSSTVLKVHIWLNVSKNLQKILNLKLIATPRICYFQNITMLSWLGFFSEIVTNF